jgi:hypothetical protein
MRLIFLCPTIQISHAEDNADPQNGRLPALRCSDWFGSSSFGGNKVADDERRKATDNDPRASRAPNVTMSDLPILNLCKQRHRSTSSLLRLHQKYTRRYEGDTDCDKSHLKNLPASGRQRIFFAERYR